ncbi:AAA family ATPase [Bradyrhizobium sp. BEA-2-5]|uniref:AAA family ATPase n=1 Tax=Bradyrhizobium sp. BEA-2-5 TaxID=3080015 RepID=UPI00293E30E1|nr:AAA family ATPase [Bradyrhizobium sp. BEA-2-5]WOH82141.1 AAA family ATPase [Bradyrhizobium sp. BEA-2-5]
MTASKSATYVIELNLRSVKSFAGKHTLNLRDSKGGPARWTLILGENGVGKTTLLECITQLTPVFNSDDRQSSKDPKMFVEPRMAQAENPVFENLARNGDVECEVKAKFAIAVTLDQRMTSPKSVETSILFSRRSGRTERIDSSSWPRKPKGWPRVERGVKQSVWKNFSKFQEPLILAYGAGRHMGVDNLDFGRAPLATDSLLKGAGELFDAEQLLLQIDYASTASGKKANEAKRQKKIFLEMIASLLPEVDDAANIRIYRPGPLGTDGKSGAYVKTLDGEVRLRQLSHGYQTMIAWLVDIGWRLFQRYPESNNPLSEPAIVLVDEIDLHLHPRWQRQLKDRLTKHFPNVQFIATAHSPLMAQSFLNANLAVVMREGDHSIIENDPTVVANWRLDQIVTSDLFGLESFWPPAIEELFEEQQRLTSKRRKTSREKMRLREIEEEMLNLPTETNPDDEEAIRIVREVAATLKSRASST